eukprot:CAMPEP_0198527882 /NCGR_PEP_ID=MMETSP1462-20131121/24814_1 /TAXON_ID=1333877 /ORGANISM="Brandtodinium nutriculum, Strain RCC3387" /LENGTH=171 /DNA_ID=CAMNT_0044257699 /DNA_START=201 /DNA_END=716 /DNA_ORIENTATION=-
MNHVLHPPSAPSALEHSIKIVANLAARRSSAHFKAPRRTRAQNATVTFCADMHPRIHAATASACRRACSARRQQAHGHQRLAACAEAPGEGLTGPAAEWDALRGDAARIASNRLSSHPGSARRQEMQHEPHRLAALPPTAWRRAACRAFCTGAARFGEVAAYLAKQTSQTS